MPGGNANRSIKGSKSKSARVKGGAEKPMGDRKTDKRTDLLPVTLVTALSVNGLNVLAKRPML